MRLIDADELINELTGKDPSACIPPYMKEHCMMMVDILENYPIAYDIGEVVAKLEREPNNPGRTVLIANGIGGT